MKAHDECLELVQEQNVNALILSSHSQNAG